MTLSARALLFFLSLFAFLFSFTSHTFAQSNPYLTPNTESNVPQNLGTTIQSVTIEVINSLNCQLVGMNPSNPSQKCLGVNPTTGQLGFVENGGGMIGLTSTMIAAMFTPPTSTSEYIAYMTEDFGITKTAHAQQNEYPQGFGFASIRPLAKIWGAFRNIVYLLFLIVFVVIGMAIMLRIHIDARTVMSIENQIPKIIIGLVMVTFSFGIAGALIDFMWLSTYVTINVIAGADADYGGPNGKPNGIPDLKDQIPLINSQLYTPPVGFANEVLQEPGGNTTGGILRYAWYGAGSVQDIISKLFAPKDFAETFKIHPPNTSSCNGIDPGCWGGSFVRDIVGNSIGTMLSQIFGWVISWFVGTLAFFVFAIAIFVALFRLWLALLQAYVFLLIDIVTAPFWILLSLMPGSKLTFGSWIREMLANLSAFPVAITLIMLGKVFMNSFGNAAVNAPFPVPLIGNPGAPNVMAALIGVGVILMVPVVVEMTRKIFGAPQFEYTKAIGQSIGVGTGAIGNVGSEIWKKATRVEHGHAIGALPTLLHRPGRFGGIRSTIAKHLFGVYQPYDSLRRH